MPMPTSRRANDEFQKRYLPSIEMIIGSCLVQQAAAMTKVSNAADLTIYQRGDNCIATRVRRAKYFVGHAHDYTVRDQLKSGKRTEIHKFLDGDCDIFFYGHVHPNPKKRVFRAWGLIDLHLWRRWYACFQIRNPGKQQWNLDHKTSFSCFTWHESQATLVAHCGLDDYLIPMTKRQRYAQLVQQGIESFCEDDVRDMNRLLDMERAKRCKFYKKDDT